MEFQMCPYTEKYTTVRERINFVQQQFYSSINHFIMCIIIQVLYIYSNSVQRISFKIEIEINFTYKINKYSMCMVVNN